MLKSDKWQDKKIVAGEGEDNELYPFEFASEYGFLPIILNSKEFKESYLNCHDKIYFKNFKPKIRRKINQEIKNLDFLSNQEYKDCKGFLEYPIQFILLKLKL